jgi:hypothetical protein
VGAGVAGMTETEKIQNLHTDARKAAEKWHKDFKNVTYSTPFFFKDENTDGGEWVRVTIEKDATLGGARQPRRRAEDELDDNRS